MSGDDVRAIVEAHRANPRQVTTMAVAFCYQRYKAQIGEVLRPADLVVALGISDSMARRAVRAARALDPEAAAAMPAGDGPDRSATAPGKRNLTVPPEPHRSGTSPFREAEPHRSAGRNGDVPHTNERDLDRERQSHTHRAGEDAPINGGESDAIRRACDVLAGNGQTEPLSGALSRSAHLPEVRALASDPWRLESAARKFLSPATPHAPRSCRNTRASLGYLLAIARGLEGPYEPPPIAPPRPDGTGPPGRPLPAVTARTLEMKAQIARRLAELEAQGGSTDE